MAMVSCVTTQVDNNGKVSPQYKEGKFHNDASLSLPGGSNSADSMIWRYLFEKPVDKTPTKPIPLAPISPHRLLAENTQGVAVYRLGHSSILLGVSGEFWLIDPVFSERASPFRWVGPKRFHPTPIALDQLPKITGVVISHDHYDHLDRKTILQLKDKVEHFVTPLGVSNHLKSWGVESNRIHELDWWQDISLGKVVLTSTPAQHFSGRKIIDNNQTLWSSWVIQAENKTLFFSGDTGYFAGFKQIGDRFGPFDLTMIENGAYDQSWPEVHMSPEETLQAHMDLRGKALMPIHNGTFDLALHRWFEPFERLSALAEKQHVPLVTPIMGERVSIDQMGQYHAWWREVSEEKTVSTSLAKSDLQNGDLELAQ